MSGDRSAETKLKRARKAPAEQNKVDHALKLLDERMSQPSAPPVPTKKPNTKKDKPKGPPRAWGFWVPVDSDDRDVEMVAQKAVHAINTQYLLDRVNGALGVVNHAADGLRSATAAAAQKNRGAVRSPMRALVLELCGPHYGEAHEFANHPTEFREKLFERVICALQARVGTAGYRDEAVRIEYCPAWADYGVKRELRQMPEAHVRYECAGKSKSVKFESLYKMVPTAKPDKK